MDISQLLLYGLLIGGFLLFNFLLQRGAQRARQRQEEAQAHPPDAPAPDDEAIDSGWGRGPAAVRRSAVPSAEATRRIEAHAPAPATPARRRSPNTLFRSRQDLRRAIIAMTVLGPCRALEPEDRR